jgi:hypothetical protein
MSAHLHTILLVFSVGLAYVWLQHPVLSIYSLQAFAGSAAIYFLIKRAKKAKLWHIAPGYISIEMTVATFAFLLLIGATGNIASPFYPLVYLHLFFLILACHVSTSFVLTALLMLFHYAISPHAFPNELGSLLSIPVMALIFLFTKHQQEEVAREKIIIEQDEAELALLRNEEGLLTSFLTSFVPQKIAQLKQLAAYAATNQEALLGQLSLLEIETENIVRKARTGAATTQDEAAATPTTTVEGDDNQGETQTTNATN